MATDISLLEGQLENDNDHDPQDVERLLIGFMRSLLEEQRDNASNQYQAEEKGLA